MASTSRVAEAGLFEFEDAAGLPIPAGLAFRDLFDLFPPDAPLRFTSVQGADAEGVMRASLRGATTVTAVQLWFDEEQLLVGEALMRANCGRAFSATYRLDRRQWFVNRG